MGTRRLAMELPSWIADHINLYKTDPEKAHLFDCSIGGGMPLTPTLLLTMKGRKSGRDISTPLIYGTHGPAYVVIASKGGAPDHPDWYKNLVADPMCHIQVGKQAYRARARTATAAERPKLWAQLQEIYPPYDDYQRTAKGREIPVVVLDPVGSPTTA
jgi:deazaflavin-dependent oxidoreductase (nitroreductase family)